jgi:hypothetical protein
MEVRFWHHELTIQQREVQVAVVRVLPNAVTGYNARGGRSSIAHFHFQILGAWAGMSLRNGVGPKAARAVREFQTASGAWRFVQVLQTKIDLPSNVLMVGPDGTIQVLPRLFQNVVDEPLWTTGFAVFELAGYVIVVQVRAFERLDDETIDAVCELLAVAFDDVNVGEPLVATT